jgi:hypothetical protein
MTKLAGPATAQARVGTETAARFLGNRRLSKPTTCFQGWAAIRH